MKNFKHLRVWQKGFELSVACYKLTSTFPRNEQFGLVSQLNRASVSIISNIAEGSSRKSDQEYLRYIEISLGSSYELEAQLLLVEALGLGDTTLTKSMIYDIREVQKMLVCFINALRNE